MLSFCRSRETGVYRATPSSATVTIAGHVPRYRTNQQTSPLQRWLNVSCHRGGEAIMAAQGYVVFIPLTFRSVTICYVSLENNYLFSRPNWWNYYNHLNFRTSIPVWILVTILRVPKLIIGSRPWGTCPRRKFHSTSSKNCGSNWIIFFNKSLRHSITSIDFSSVYYGIKIMSGYRESSRQRNREAKLTRCGAVGYRAPVLYNLGYAVILSPCCYSCNADSCMYTNWILSQIKKYCMWVYNEVYIYIANIFVNIFKIF